MTRSDFVHIASFNVTVLNDAAVPAFPLLFDMLLFFFRFFVRFEARYGLPIGSPSPKKLFVPSEVMPRYFFGSYPYGAQYTSAGGLTETLTKTPPLSK